MSWQKENPSIPDSMEGILPSPRLVGTSKTSSCPEPDQTIPVRFDQKKNQIFPGTLVYQFPISLRDPTKTESPRLTSGLLRPPRGGLFKIKPRNRQGFQIWKKNPGLTYNSDGTRKPALIFRQ